MTSTSIASLKNANAMSLNNQDSAQAFVDTILLYAKNLEADAVSNDLQVNNFIVNDLIELVL